MLNAAIVLALLGQGSTAPKPVTELVADVQTLAPGKPFTVALHMKLPAGWHNYYANPGESGVPTTITWSLPAGYRAGPIRWPVPERIVVGEVPMYGYQHEVWLSTTVTPPIDARTGSQVILRARADWLLCAAECVPQSAELTLRLKVGKTAVANPDPGLTSALTNLPKRTLPWPISAQVAGKSIELTVVAHLGQSKGATFFPADPDSFTADPAQRVAASDRLRLDIPMSRYALKAPKRLVGILVMPSLHRSYWVDTPVTS